MNSLSFKLEVPLDASGIEDFKPDRQVKVAVQNTQGAIQAQMIKFDDKGRGTAKFAFAERPGNLSIAVGPPDASDQELFGLQTLGVNLPAKRWKEPHLVLPPLRIPPFHWHWWWRWCRTFTIRGRVVCAGDRPVPGATVCAFDVDAWWWWSSRQLVGCATTDATGAFEIKFRWCCGWWPWWWWRQRVWHLDPFLLERIIPPLQREPKLHPIPLPDPAPDLRIFEQLLGGQEFAALNLGRHVAPTTAVRKVAATEVSVIGASAADAAQLPVNPSVLGELRDRLAARLPRIPELEPLHLWPWWPWEPWWDCSPDIIFRVTQDCRMEGTVIVDEGYGNTRWNIPTSLDVTLQANSQACCLPDVPPDPDGTCALITAVCDNPINIIGGNPPHAPVTPAPVGYLSPGAVSDYGDRPYAGNVLLQGQVGDAVDYYEFQWSDDGGANWHDMPTSGVGDVPRQYWIPTTNTFQWVPFLTTKDTRLVFESRQHYEATHDPGSWNITRFWMAPNYLSLMYWLTQTPFLNGTYRLRLKGWQLVNGHLANPLNLDFLPVCSLQTPAEVVLRIDNRLEGAASGHPMADPNHPCGSGTVHTCTLEPDTDFLGVRIVHRDANGVPTGQVTEVGACGNVPISSQDLLQVDFFAHDPEGHLAYYTLITTYRENLARNLLALPGVSLTPLGGAPVPAAVQVGPDYAIARSANPLPVGGATAPTWRGGAIRLEVLARSAFPETCCYQLELRAHKRTVVSCDHSLWGHTNYSEYSFMIVV